ncbi:hypothetical protein [Cohnella cholangitidis]|uniref:Uncharacterized protein n=1 Tax=Cohnella cholangitidis TaxID=2598458 RepID=A0A7G5C697_9BACL|nr:hypothetical protein [Cohnella cholangitidis]QMV44731.1 hypothetical protein FPL14_28860 [Cohnella cholangitidis]
MILPENLPCLFCQTIGQTQIKDEVLYFSCLCTAGKGWYTIDRNCYDDYKMGQYQEHIISGYIRELSEDAQRVHIDADNIDQIVRSPLIPKHVRDKVDKLIVYLYRNTAVIGEPVYLSETDFNLTYSPKSTELYSLLDYLKSKGYLDPKGYVDISSRGTIMTPEGLEIGYDLLNRRIKSTQCFIAMSFSLDLLHSFKEHVMPRIRETGFEPVTVDIVQHNENIVDRIIYEIKNSRFVVADFTQQKHGVYYEAGYAKGLGLEVIWTVHEDDIKNCHFDTRQMNHIVWRSVEELGERLRDRILATIPGARHTKTLLS